MSLHDLPKKAMGEVPGLSDVVDMELNRPTVGESASKVLLIDVDSRIPNLALMKLSAWHKARGDEVGFNVTNPTHVYASVVFKKNKHRVDGLRYYYPDAEIMVGGSGYDLAATLPAEVERLAPDYSLYPGLDYSMGFTSRGCVRNCYFCIVPGKEGKYRRVQHPREFVQHDKVKLLDNNWYADRDWFFETSNWLIEHNVAVDVTQGMDIRLLTPEIAAQLKRLRWWRPMHFAFDDMSSKEAVLRGLDILKAEGFDLKHDLNVYVYCHDDTQYDDAVARCRILRSRMVTAYVMCNIDQPRTPRMIQLQRWTARPWIYYCCDIADYDRSVKGHIGMDKNISEVSP